MMMKKMLLYVCCLCILNQTYANVWYVTNTSQGSADGTSWLNGSSSLQEIITNADVGDSIFVQEGKYYPSHYITYNTPFVSTLVSDSAQSIRDKTFLLKSGISLFGGFSGNEITLSQSNPSLYPTILSGDLLNNDAITGAGQTLELDDVVDNVFHVVCVQDPTVMIHVQGLIIEGGNGDETTDFQFLSAFTRPRTWGGALFICNTYNMFSMNNCIIRHNQSSAGAVAVMSGGGFFKNVQFVENGFANSNGGAFYHTGSNVVIDHCLFQGNLGNNGGALQSESGFVTITNSIFNENYGDVGGAIQTTSNNMLVDSCTFFANISNLDGGAIDADNVSTLDVKHSLFALNVTDGWGGAIQTNSLESFVSNCKFTDNSASYYGGAISKQNGLMVVKKSYFKNNVSLENGGAIYSNTNIDSIISCGFDSNRCDYLGGAIAFKSNTFSFQNSIFIGSNALEGGGLSTENSLQGTVSNCTFYNNTSSNTSNDFYDDSGNVPTNVTFNNSIFWGSASIGANYTINSCCFQDTSMTNGTNLLYKNPGFINAMNLLGDDNELGTNDDGFQLIACSPLINAGDNALNIINVDVKNDARVNESIIDIGAYENILANTISGRDSSQCDSIFFSLNSLITGDTLNIFWHQDSMNGVVINPMQTFTASHSYYAIDSNGSIACLDSAVVNLVVLPSATKLYVNQNATGKNTGLTWQDAFTDLQDALTASTCSNTDSIWVAKGIYYPTSGTDRTISFDLKNSKKLYGGFVGNETALTQRNIAENETILSGDIGNQSVNTDNSEHVIKCTYVTDNPILSGFSIRGGYADAMFPSYPFGGAIFMQSASPIIEKCAFYNNFSKIQGGALVCFNDASPAISQCVFTKNSTEQYGAAIAMLYNSNPIITNTTFIGNQTTFGNYGSSLYAQFNASPLYINCVIDNPLCVGVVNDVASGCSSKMVHCLVNMTIQTPMDSVGNFWDYQSQVFDMQAPWGADAKPMTADDGLRLKPCSPAIDHGLNNILPITFLQDFINNPRTYNINIDMGAYEYNDTAYFKYVTNANETFVSNWSCTADDQWTYFYDLNNGKLLLGLRYTEQMLGLVDAKITTTAYYGNGNCVDLHTAPYAINPIHAASNRNWVVTTQFAPTNKVGVRYFYTSTDVTDLQGCNASMTSADSFLVVKIDNTNNPFDLNAQPSDYHEYALSNNASEFEFSLGNYLNNTFVEYYVNNFSGGYVGTKSSIFPLPLNAIELKVQAQNRQAHLQWTCQVFDKFSTFDIERSIDGIRFERMQTQNPNKISAYKVIDKDPLSGTNYYRIKATQNDGSIQYSNIEHANFDASFEEAFAIYPNPSSGSITVESTVPSKFTINNMLGEVVRTIEIQKQAVTIHDLPSGVYFISNNNKTWIKKITILK
jgi:predicted outer membrane repeat protein